MRVLVADRNARLLESISLTFAGQFEIHTASTRELCGDFLQQNVFDLIIVSDRLADGPGLPLLGEIARSSPDTLRVFAAKRPRLQFLKGKLGPFGLFRTLVYPIDPRGLLSTLTLARAGLQIVESAPETQFRPPDVSTEPPKTQIRPPDVSAPPPQPVSPFVAPQPHNGRSQPGDSRSQPRDRAPDPQSVALLLARLQPPLLVRRRPQLPTKRSAPSQTAAIPPTIIRPALPAALPSQNESGLREFKKRSESQAAAAVARVATAAPSRGRAKAPALATGTAYRPTRSAAPAEVRPKRVKVFAGTALAAAVVATIAIFRPFDGAARPASTEPMLAANADSSPAPNTVSDPAPDPQMQRAPVPSTEAKLIVSKPPDNSARDVPEPTAETPSPAPFEVGAALSQTAAVNTPVADPSSFGSEAAEPIYSN